MAAQVKYTKYRLTDHENRVVFETDFSNDLTVEQGILKRVALDMYSFTAGREENYLSELTISGEKDAVIIKRDHKAGSTQLLAGPESDPNFFWLPDEFGNDIASAKNPNVILPDLAVAIAGVKAYIEGQAGEDTNSKIARLRKELVTLIGEEKGNALLTLEDKLSAMDAEFTAQRDADQALLGKGELEEQLVELERQIQSLNTLVRQKNDVHAKLQKYAHLLGDDVGEKSLKLREEIGRMRLEGILQEAKADHVAITRMAAVQEATEAKKPKLLAGWLLFPIVGTVVIALGGFMIAGSVLSLIVGLSIALLQIGFYVLLNMAEVEVDVVSPEGVISDSIRDNTPGSTLNTQPEQRIGWIEKFFIDKAWLEVLKNEYTEINKLLNEVSSNSTPEQLAGLKTELTAEISRLNALIEKQKGKEIPPGEYLKKRREFDTLKMELSRMEEELSSHAEAKNILSLRADIAELFADEVDKQNNQGENTFWGRVVDPELADARIDNDKLQLFTKGSWREATQNELLALFAFAKLIGWEGKPSLPLIVVDILRYLPPLAQPTFSDRMVQARSAGQVVFIGLKA